MKTADLFRNKCVFSFEVFPPKIGTPVEGIYKTLDELKGLPCDFISVTFGAGGGGNSQESLNIASAIKAAGLESVAHLPGIGLKKAQIAAILEELKARGVENILALRGDLPQEQVEQGDFRYASDLIPFIKEQGDFNIIAACYPEGHIESRNKVQDIRHLKTKVEAGADHLISQLFFDNGDFYRFLERCALAGIEVPIQAGIMPVVNKKQIERMTSLCGARLPKKFVRILERYEHNPVAMRDAGIAYAIEQIVDLLSHDVDGIHLYTMNNPYIARRIHESVFSLIAA